MKEIIFLIEEDPEGGFNARAFGASIHTEGESMEEIKKNILTALRCHYENENDIPKIIRLHYVKEEIMTYA
jgi:predicted RNase H-like HicB family nuclease